MYFQISSCHHSDVFFILASIADEFLSFLSVCLDNHMSRMGNFSRHELIADEFLDFFFLWPDSHMSHMDISSLCELIVGVFLRFLRELLEIHMSHNARWCLV